MLSIGEFSKVTQLSIKALRLYHEKGILIPGKVDVQSNYRYYRSQDVEKGLIIRRLKDMGFSLDEIKMIVQECTDDQQIVRFVESKLDEVNRTISEYKARKESLDIFLEQVEQNKGEKMSNSMQIEREVIPEMLVCSIRFKGKYEEVGARFGTLYKKCMRVAVGKPFSLYFDGDFKDECADIEACVQVKKEIPIKNSAGQEEINFRKLKGGNAVTLIHVGPYDDLGRSYQQLYEYCRENSLKTVLPSMEQYIKGPGMIFWGNPKKYITKLIHFIE